MLRSIVVSCTSSPAVGIELTGGFFNVTESGERGDKLGVTITCRPSQPGAPQRLQSGRRYAWVFDVTTSSGQQKVTVKLSVKDAGNTVELASEELDISTPGRKKNRVILFGVSP